MSFSNALEHMSQAIVHMEKSQQEFFDEIDDSLKKLQNDMNVAFLSQKEPQLSSIGTECTSTFDPVTNKVVGESQYWARPRIDKHTQELYDEIFKWCEETYSPAAWIGDSNLQIYYFNRVEDRDWFVLKWS